VPSHRGPATSLSPISRRPPATGRTSSERCGCIKFLYDLFYGRSYIAARAESSIPFLLDEKPAVVPVRLAVEQSGGKRKVSYGDARSNSERAAPSACVGRRLSAPQIVWNRSTRRAGARGGPRVGRPR